MIRIRGPVGTLRVLMLPGESDPVWEEMLDGERVGVTGRLEGEARVTREVRRDQ